RPATSTILRPPGGISSADATTYFMSPVCVACHPELAKDPRLRRSQREADSSSPALREASLRAEPTGLPCAKRACERSPRVPPQDDSSPLTGQKPNLTLSERLRGERPGNGPRARRDRSAARQTRDLADPARRGDVDRRA